MIPSGIIASLAPGVTNGRKLAERLVSVGLWHLHDAGFSIHDFLDWNPTRAEIEASRASDRDRKRKGIQPESEKIPNGIQTTPSRAYAGDAGSGSLKGSSLSSLERGAGENLSRPVGLMSRRRLELSNEGEPVPLRWDQFKEIQALSAPSFGGDFDAAYGPTLAWVHEVGAELTEKGTPRGAVTNPWQFWRERAEAKWCVEPKDAEVDRGAENIRKWLAEEAAKKAKAMVK